LAVGEGFRDDMIGKIRPNNLRPARHEAGDSVRGRPTLIREEGFDRVTEQFRISPIGART
jgi:hypothetical protein